MKGQCEVVFLLFVALIVFLFVDAGKGSDLSQKHIRPRRFLGFRNTTHFFVRINFKANMVPWNQLFAQAVGFRINWDEPPDTFHPHHRLYRRDLYNHIETLLDRNGITGFHCIRRAICETNKATPTAIYHKILKIVFRNQSAATAKWHNMTAEECQESILTCPFSIFEVSRFTDI